jgi:acyl-coenzyme A thioesterase PaaI-like protein
MSAITDHPASSGINDCHSRCILCGHRNPWSLNLSFQTVGEGVVSTRFKTHAALQGYDGILHGGVIAALLDAAMTHCLFYQGVQAVTGDLRVRFVKPISCAASLEIRAWILDSHPPLYRVKAEISHDRQIMARAEAKFVWYRGSS